MFLLRPAEVKRALQIAECNDEQQVMAQIAASKQAGSASSGIYQHRELNRERVREITKNPSSDGMQQETFSNLKEATRYKILHGRNLSEVKCPKCGGRDSWGHCQKSNRNNVPIAGGLEKLGLREVDKTMDAICTRNPAMNAQFIGEKTERDAQ